MKKTGDVRFENFSDCTDFAFPLDRFNPDGVRGVGLMVYSYGALLNKATGSRFFCSERMAEALKDKGRTKSMDSILRFMDAWKGDISGLSISDGFLYIDGFPREVDEATRTDYLKLSMAMVAYANQHPMMVRAKRIIPENEKYCMRAWLIRLGLNGKEFSSVRKTMSRNLSGNNCYKSDADNKAFNDRYAALGRERRAAARAARESGQND
ncbi:MAG: hypothetical protein IIZ39_08685 [Blautia sp.]|nr:hypothetical protein [Blautia sp.]